ncbi:cytochrome b [Polaromonas sp. CG_9.11]|uniref:cytochrome b n=1 Tax=Polaromonas sp. CG_9.11 TaxID=2787730 RepID=UPI000AD486D7|nr:cytochrome b [Polaromonas sp. CG_9.11]MBG6075472.1 cytochrome b561 [Polaromonas sp. CG_9.11]
MDMDMEARYTRTAMLLHWLVALLLLGQFAFGWYLQDIARGTPARGYFVNLHKSCGLLIGLLILVRLGWRLSHTPPALPDTIPTWQQQAALASHYLLYVLMLVMPLSGYMASNFSRFGIKFFNVIQFAPWGIDSKLVYGIFNQTHIVTSWLLLALVTVHVLAAIKHLLVDHDSVFSRMLPQRLPVRR